MGYSPWGHKESDTTEKLTWLLSKISVVPKLSREIGMNSPLPQGAGDLAVSQEFILKYQLLLKEWGGVQLLATQKPRDKSGWWKRKFALFQTLATGVGGWQTSVQRPTLPHLASRVARAFIDRGRGLPAVIAQSALTVIFKLVVGGLTSIILIVWGTVNLQFQDLFVPISLRPVLRIVAAYAVGMVWSSCIGFFTLVF